MNDRTNSRFRFLMRSLPFVLLGTLLLVSTPNEAQAFFQQQQEVKKVKTDQNGRSASDVARRGAPQQVETETPSRDVLVNGSDQDGGKALRPASNKEVQDTPQCDVLDVGTVEQAALRVLPGAPAGSMHIDAEGDIGFGTEAPEGRLHVVAKQSNTARDILLLDDNGNLEIGGVLTEASSALLKENFAPVDAAQLLAHLATLPIGTWNYKTDDPSVRHMGPTAQDFYAAFGLGADDEHIAPLDANGVALVALQALYQQLQAQSTHIDKLEEQNAQLLQRLSSLEALVRQQ